MKKKKSVASTVLSVICWVLIALLALTVVYLLVMRVSGKTPRVFGYTCLCIVTPSMEPTIETGSFIVIRDVDTAELSEGDIITFVSHDPAIDGRLNTHRIEEIKNDENGLRFVTKGDNNPAQDDLEVPASDVTGIYVCTLGFLSAFSGILQSQYAFLFVILIPAFVFFIYQMVRVAKASYANKTENETGENKKDTEDKKSSGDGKDD